MDFVMEYEKAKKMLKEDGWDGFLDHFQDQYEELDLYSCSTYWENDKSYICKFRGAKGDMIMGWKGVHDRG